MIHGILEIEGVPFLRRLLNCRLGTGVLGIEGGENSGLAASGERRSGGCEAVLQLLCVSAPLFGNPVIYVRRAMNESDPCGLTSAEETHRIDVHQTQFLQVQKNPCSAGGNLSLEFLHMLRLHSANQPDRRAMLVRH